MKTLDFIYNGAGAYWYDRFDGDFFLGGLSVFLGGLGLFLGELGLFRVNRLKI